MKHFLLGVLVASVFQAGASLAVDDGNYWWQQQQLQRDRQINEDTRRQQEFDRQRSQLRREPC